MDFTLVLLIILILLIVGYFYVIKKHKYWENLGFPYAKPQFFFGNVRGIGTSKHSSQLFQEAYREMKNKGIIGGIYFFVQPVAIVLDLDILKNILVKDFQYFHDRGMYVNERDDPLSGHLFSLPGQKWKVMRAKLSPTFTSGKMKMMHSTIVAVAKELQKTLHPYAMNREDIELRDFLARFTTDVIGNCAFGIDCNSLKDPNTEFRRAGKKVFEFNFTSLVRALFIQVFPDIAKKLHLSLTDKEVTEFFLKLLKDTLEYREQNNIVRNDFLSLLIQLKNTGKLEGDNVDLGKISFEELAAQTFLFFIAGFETSSSTMALALYEMALNQEIQDRVRQEVLSVLERFDGEYTYEACMEMKYLGRVIYESLRKYPIVDNLVRLVTNDYQIPGTKLTLKKGTGLITSIYSIHRDPEIYPNPERFDPDRFTEDEIAKRHPMAWLPFGEGPRMCIGTRFGMMQTKIGLASVISHYSVNATQKTPIPLIIDPKGAFLSAKGGMWLKIEKV
ncbi:Cytochrome P450 [Sergentomyia squamirostris]